MKTATSYVGSMMVDPTKDMICASDDTGEKLKYNREQVDHFYRPGELQARPDGSGLGIQNAICPRRLGYRFTSYLLYLIIFVVATAPDVVVATGSTSSVRVDSASGLLPSGKILKRTAARLKH
jgi:hypothetical protein